MTSIAATPAPTLSILLVCWNHARFLEQCIGSIASQKSREFEIVFLDNVSSDGSFELAERLFDRFGLTATMIRNETPQSIPANCNRLLAASSGSIVAPLSTDDWYDPVYVDTLMAAARADPNAGWFSCSGWLFFDADQTSVPVDETNFATDRSIDEAILDGREPHFFVGCAYRRSALASVDGWDETQLIEDRDLFLRLSRGNSHHRIPHRLVHYRRSSATASANPEFMTRGWDLFYHKHAALFGNKLSVRRAETDRAAAALAVDCGKSPLAARLLVRSLVANPFQPAAFQTIGYLVRSVLRTAARRN